MNYFSDKGLNISITPGGDLKIQGLSYLEDDLRNHVLQYAKTNKWRIVFEIQTQDKTIQQKIDALWKKATIISDWIDNPELDIPWQKRAAKVPELQEMSAEIDRLQAFTKAGGENNNRLKPVTENRSHSLESFSLIPQFPEPKKYQQDRCSARCKQSGKCYGIAYFDAKPGKALMCVPNQCLWSNQLKQQFNIKDDQK